jgi:hypothetical protein
MKIFHSLHTFCHEQPARGIPEDSQLLQGRIVIFLIIFNFLGDTIAHNVLSISYSSKNIVVIYIPYTYMLL